LETAVHWPAGEDAFKTLQRGLDAITGAIYTVGLLALGIWLTRLGWSASAIAAWAAAGLRIVWTIWHRRR